jgi:hypothetical protein
LYGLKNGAENEKESLKYFTDLHNHLKNESDPDIDSVELSTEIQNIKQLLISCLDII